MTEISEPDTMMILRAAIPGLFDMYTRDPIGGRADRLVNIIARLNDGTSWSREDIADWLDSLDLDLEIKPFDDIPPLRGCGWWQ